MTTSKKKSQDVILEWSAERIGGSLMSARTIENQTQADKMVDDYLRNILPTINVDIHVRFDGKDDVYKYVLEPKDYAVMLLNQMKKRTLESMKSSLLNLVQVLEEYDEEETE